MSKRMNRIATVENLMGNRPSLTAIGSLPHSKGASFTGVSRLGAMRAGMPSSAPATPAAKANVRRIVTYSMSAARLRRVRLLPGVIRRAHERTRLDVREPQGAAGLGQLRE